MTYTSKHTFFRRLSSSHSNAFIVIDYIFSCSKYFYNFFDYASRKSNVYSLVEIDQKTKVGFFMRWVAFFVASHNFRIFNRHYNFPLFKESFMEISYATVASFLKCIGLLLFISNSLSLGFFLKVL